MARTLDRFAVRSGECTSPPPYIQGDPCDAILLGRRRTSISTSLHNTILLLPDLLLPHECDALIADVERYHAAAEASSSLDADCGAAWSRSTYGGSGGYYRYQINQLSAATRDLFNQMLRARLLPLIAAQLPDVEDLLWHESSRACAAHGSRLEPPPPREGAVPLAEQRYRFAPQEPAINRYSTDGHFAPHTDGQALTVNVLLRAPRHVPAPGEGNAGGGVVFSGGGTAFWAERDEGEEYGDSPVTVEPRVGVGVLFNGRVRHAGVATTGGVRHVLVASFSIAGANYKSNAERRREKSQQLLK